MAFDGQVQCAADTWRKRGELYALRFQIPEDACVESMSIPPRPEVSRPVVPYTFNNSEQYAWAIDPADINTVTTEPKEG